MHERISPDPDFDTHLARRLAKLTANFEALAEHIDAIGGLHHFRRAAGADRNQGGRARGISLPARWLRGPSRSRAAADRCRSRRTSRQSSGYGRSRRTGACQLNRLELGGVLQFLLERGEQRVQLLCICRFRVHGRAGGGDWLGRRKLRSKWDLGRRGGHRASRRFSLGFFEKVAMQYVVVAAHHPEGRPIAHNKNNETANYDLKHRSTRDWCIVSMSRDLGQYPSCHLRISVAFGIRDRASIRGPDQHAQVACRNWRPSTDP